MMKMEYMAAHDQDKGAEEAEWDAEVGKAVVAMVDIDGYGL